MENWKRLLLLAACLIIAAGASPAYAQKDAGDASCPPGIWCDPGRNPYVGDPQLYFDTQIPDRDMPADARQKMYEIFKQAVVSLKAFERRVNAAEGELISTDDKRTLIKKARGRSFLTQERMVEIGTPAGLINEIMTTETERAKLIAEGALIIVPFQEGQRCLYMAYGKNLMDKSVVFRPAKGKLEAIPPIHRLDGGLKAYLFSITLGEKKYVVRMPTVCDNLCLYVDTVHLTATSVAITSPPAQALTPASGAQPQDVRQLPDDKVHIFVLTVWDPTSLPEHLRLSSFDNAKQARIIGSEILKAAGEQKLKQFDTAKEKPVFRVRFAAANFAALRGMIVERNGEPYTIPNDFGPESWIEIEVGKVRPGRGYLKVPRGGWAGEETAMVVVTPWLNPTYPDSGSLKTCAETTQKVCGGGRNGELLRVLEDPRGRSFFHFVR